MMACIFEYKGKQYTQDELVGALKNIPLNEMVDFVPGINKVPDAPFKKTWDELALKKALTEAVKNGYDQISWTPGEAQAARYDLSKSIGSLKATPIMDQHGLKYEIRATSPNGLQEVVNSVHTADELPNVVGKEMAKKIIDETEGKQPKTFKGLDLKVGGQGMKAFYDKMLVDKMNALTKKYGGKVEQKEIPLDTKKPTDFKDFADWEKAKAEDRKQPIHVLKITPELREHVLKKGFPLFSAGVPVFSPVDGDPFAKKE